MYVLLLCMFHVCSEVWYSVFEAEKRERGEEEEEEGKGELTSYGFGEREKRDFFYS